MQTKTYINCPTCNGNRILIIPGQPCPQCLGAGMVEVKTQDILADFAGPKKTCNTCKHWTRQTVYDFPNDDKQTRVGCCSMVVKLRYWDIADDAQEQVSDGKMGGENVYTHEAFGCVNYEPKQ